VPHGAAYNYSELCILTKHTAALYAKTAKRENKEATFFPLIIFAETKEHFLLGNLSSEYNSEHLVPF
jgi:hypothetical protein